MKALRITVLLLLCFSPLAALPGPSPVADSITILHLKKVGTRVTLDSVQVVAGKLKTPKHVNLSEGDLRLSVRSLQGVELSLTAIADPSVQRLEYVDSLGQLQTRVEYKDSVHFTVRVPHDSAGYSVDLHRVVPAAGHAVSKEPQDELVGSFVIRARESGHD